MDLELHQLDRRYEALRTRNTARERRLLGSIAEHGQQMPIVVVREAESFVVIDGYKRLRALGRLGVDTVGAVQWALEEAEALLLERTLRAGDGDSPIEQGWLLRELITRFGLGLELLARRLCRSKSWVSRRIALVSELPASVQEHVRAGRIGGHAAMKYLVPLARANGVHCARLGDGIAPERPTSREVAELYAAYCAGNAATRERVVAAPVLVLRARAAVQSEGAGATPVAHLLEDLRIAGAVARRAHGRLGRGALDGADPDERSRVREAGDEAYEAALRLKKRCDKELGTEVKDARPDDAVGDPAPL